MNGKCVVCGEPTTINSKTKDYYKYHKKCYKTYLSSKCASGKKEFDVDLVRKLYLEDNLTWEQIANHPDVKCLKTGTKISTTTLKKAFNKDEIRSQAESLKNYYSSDRYENPYNYDVDKAIELYVSDKSHTAVSVAKIIGCSPSAIIHWLNDRGIELRKPNVSSYEHFIKDYLIDELALLEEQVMTNVIGVLSGNKELDIYLPYYDVAIEINGIYWHSELYKKPNYHIDKYKECVSWGIRLLQFTDEQITNSPTIIKSIIANALGKNYYRYYGRDLIIKSVDKKEEKLFLDNNHIQGYIPSKLAYGLYTEDNELVSIMTFGKPRFDKSYQWEILRFASKTFSSVVGGASKLYKHFITINNPTSIISYADVEYATGKVYEKLGMEFIRHTEPSYRYYVNGKDYTISRFTFQKRKDKLQSEKDFMLDNNLSKLYNSGNLVYATRR